MKTNILSILIILTGICSLSAQTDTLPQPFKILSLEQKIDQTRKELRKSLDMEDPISAGMWIDSLGRLEDDTYVGLSWDERWLLYFWMENYGTLLTEARDFGPTERENQSYKVPPPPDSLFETIDGFMFEKQYQVFQSIRHAFLNDQEKAFCTILLEYLLRLNTNDEEWGGKIDAFAQKYPNSSYLYFLNGVKPAVLKAANKGVSISMSFLSGSWSGQLDRSIRPLYALHIDGSYWVDRWNILATMVFGGPKVARDISDGVEIPAKNDPTSFVGFGVELGYDLINQKKLRMFPVISGGITFFLGPRTPDEDSGEEVPEYYDNFQFFEGHLGVSLVADLKMFRQQSNEWGMPKGSYHGIRARVGYNWMNFGGQNPYLRGNLFYFAIGYNLFGYLEAKKK